jgi:hypothetical protein
MGWGPRGAAGLPSAAGHSFFFTEPSLSEGFVPKNRGPTMTAGPAAGGAAGRAGHAARAGHAPRPWRARGLARRPPAR